MFVYPVSGIWIYKLSGTIKTSTVERCFKERLQVQLMKDFIQSSVFSAKLTVFSMPGAS